MLPYNILMRYRQLAARGTGHVRALPGAVPPALLVLLAVLSVQFGAAFAKGLFSSIGPLGTVFLRVGFAAIVLMAVWRPRLRGYSRRDYTTVALFGATIALMNSTFYTALAHIPLGIAVTVEFVGPLGVAIFGSRRWLDALWIVLAVGGILLLAPIGGEVVDLVGVLLALVAGACWAAYILLNVRVGRAFPGGSGLAIGFLVAAILLAPLGIYEGGPALLDPSLLFVGVGVALLSSVIPFSLELEALRKLPASVFGVLLSAEPGVAAISGFLVLGESLGVREILALVLITVAAGGSSRTGSGLHPTPEAPLS